jgi:hypothetical protein
MTKYTHEQRLQVLGVCKDCADGQLPLSLAEKRVRSLVPSYPVENLSGEISRLKKYCSGKGAYGHAYPATWAKALLELTGYDPRVVTALREQQELYYARDGRKNRTLERLLDSLRSQGI